MSELEKWIVIRDVAWNSGNIILWNDANYMIECLLGAR